MRESLPLIGVINNENKKHIYKDPRPICYAFYSLDFFELLKSKLKNFQKNETKVTILL